MSAISASQPLSAVSDADEQRSLGRSLALHILPGIFILVLFVITAPLAMQAGLPPLVPVLGSAALGLAFQVWHLFHEGKKRNGRWTLKGIVQYNEPIPLRSYLTVLFTLYHFWQPYYWLTQFLTFLPVAYAVWWKRNAKVSIIIHALLKIFGGLLTFALILGQ